MGMVQEVIEEVRQNIFSIGLNDFSAKLSKLNSFYGLSKINHVLKRFDENPPFCLFGPDASITRNKNRWNSGFGYGCLVKFNEKFAFPEIRPNACGTTLVILDTLPEENEMLEKANELDQNPPEMEGLELDWNLGSGNHFIEFLKFVDKPKYAALFHGSPSERKPFLYDMDNWLEKGEVIETPWGEIIALFDQEAMNYFNVYKEIEKFGLKKRKTIAEKMIPEGEVVSNEIHQGMSNSGEIRLGLHDTSQEGPFPIGLRPGLPVYLYKGQRNIEKEVLGEKGFPEKLKDVNILPHGGGYKLELQGEPEVIENGRYRFFKGQAESGKPYIFSYPRALPYTYRGEEIIEKVEEYNLGEKINKLTHEYTIKI